MENNYFGDNVDSKSQIYEIYADNLESSFVDLRKAAEKYNYVAMDTEFPGTICDVIRKENIIDYYFKTVQANADQLKLIQLGLTFYSSDGKRALDVPTFQFNFKFFEKSDQQSKKSIELLRFAGVNFFDLESKGIDHEDFAELFITSGLAFNADIKWLAFHSGYDFAYLLKFFTDLPDTEKEFLGKLNLVFPNIYDTKYIAAIHNIKGGLQSIANGFNLERHGSMHQAGSDSLLTGDLYFRMEEEYQDKDNYKNILYGIDKGCIDDI